MTTEISVPVLNLWQKLIEVRKLVTYLQKENSSTQFKYVSNSQVLLALRAKMDELGLLLVPSVTGHNVRESSIDFPSNDGTYTAKRTTTYFTEMDMSYTWVNAENPSERETAPWYAQGVDIAGEKGVGKAATYGEKYFLLKFFNIPTDLDDPDHATNQPPTEGAAPSKTPSTPSAPPKAPNESSPPPSASQPPPPPTTTPVALVTDGQIRMLNAKASAAGYKKEDKNDLMEAITILLGRTIVSINEIRKTEVDKVAKWLLDQTQSTAAN